MRAFALSWPLLQRDVTLSIRAQAPTGCDDLRQSFVGTDLAPRSKEQVKV
jgi:hypothetical protein